ncbi:hypothetical protein HQ576_03055 [bacterium]|nr:hypothetical protein [bacterium]
MATERETLWATLAGMLIGLTVGCAFYASTLRDLDHRVRVVETEGQERGRVVVWDGMDARVAAVLGVVCVVPFVVFGALSTRRSAWPFLRQPRSVALLSVLAGLAVCGCALYLARLFMRWSLLAGT